MVFGVVCLSSLCLWIHHTILLLLHFNLALYVELSRSLVMKFNNRKESIDYIIPYEQVLNVPLWSPPHFLCPLTHLAVDGARKLALAS